MIGSIGPLEIGIVLLVVLLVFGARRLPELGSGLGRGLREFKQGITGEEGARGPEEIGPAAPPEADGADAHRTPAG